MPQNLPQTNVTSEDAPLLEGEVNSAAISLLRTWREKGDEREQRETLEELAQSLNEDRPSYRPIF